MSQATNGDVTVHYDSVGSPGDPAILLIMGLGSQLIAWRPGFCRILADAGFRVVRLDNRDVGLSSKTPGVAPDAMALATARADRAAMADVPYLFDDMADDAVAVLDDLGLERAHVVGLSMGGMITQQVAIDHPGRVASITSIMSSTGAPGVGQPGPEMAAELIGPVPTTRGEAIDEVVRSFRVIAGPHFDEDVIRATAVESYERCWHPSGVGFQLAALMASPDRTAQLGQVDVPALVVHGRVDPLVPLDAGQATAEAIPGARLVIHDEMGHHLAPVFWPVVTDDLIAHARAAESDSSP